MSINDKICCVQQLENPTMACRNDENLLCALDLSKFIHSFIFTCFRRATLQQSWFSRGPLLKRKRYIYKVKYNSIINIEKKGSTKLKGNNEWCYAIMTFSFSLKVGKVLAFPQSLGSEFQILAPPPVCKAVLPKFRFHSWGP